VVPSVVQSLTLAPQHFKKCFYWHLHCNISNFQVDTELEEVRKRIEERADAADKVDPNANPFAL
jgi:hypothetical protein